VSVSNPTTCFLCRRGPDVDFVLPCPSPTCGGAHQECAITRCRQPQCPFREGSGGPVPDDFGRTIQGEASA